MKEYPQIKISEWEPVGEGYNGQAYVSEKHPGKLLKIVRTEMGTAAKIEQEFYASRVALEAGLPTPEVYEIVRDGKDHGYISERIAGKKSFSRLCADQPERIPEYAAQMAGYAKDLHKRPISIGPYVPSVKSLLLSALDSSPIVSEGQRKWFQSFVSAMPDSGTCLHGDMQPGNIILARGKPYWIDLGWLSQGCHMMDLAHLYKMMVDDSVIPQVQDLTHLTSEQMKAFWEAFARSYTGKADVEALNRELLPYAALDMVRSFYLHPNYNPAFMDFCRARIGGYCSAI